VLSSRRENRPGSSLPPNFFAIGTEMGDSTASIDRGSVSSAPFGLVACSTFGAVVVGPVVSFAACSELSWCAFFRRNHALLHPWFAVQEGARGPLAELEDCACSVCSFVGHTNCGCGCSHRGGEDGGESPRGVRKR